MIISEDYRKVKIKAKMSGDALSQLPSEYLTREKARGSGRRCAKPVFKKLLSAE